MPKQTTTIRPNPLNVISDSLDRIARLRQHLKTIGHLDGVSGALGLLDQLEDAVAEIGFDTELAQEQGR